MKNLIPHKWSLVMKIFPLVVGVLLTKLLFHSMGWEYISVNSLFTSIISANVFLLGFLLAGTLSDYKESERIPGELAASMETIADECAITYKHKKAKEAKACLHYVAELNTMIQGWLHKKVKTNDLLQKVTGLNDFYLAFESITQPNFIVRLKQEQNSIRRFLIRIHTIRETSFVAVGYAIAELTTALLIIGFIIAKIDPFYESIFFVGIAAFLMMYMIALIKDLDNPFDYYEGEKESAHVSLTPLIDLEDRLHDKLKSLK